MDMASIQRQLAAMQKKSGGSSGQTPPNNGGGKGGCKGGGSTFCKASNKWLTPACYSCQIDRPADNGPGRPVLPLATAIESMLKKQLTVASAPPVQ
eukprot:2439258-Amphidinium_carterae.1